MRRLCTGPTNTGWRSCDIRGTALVALYFEQEARHHCPPIREDRRLCYKKGKNTVQMKAFSLGTWAGVMRQERWDSCPQRQKRFPIMEGPDIRARQSDGLLGAPSFQSGPSRASSCLLECMRVYIMQRGSLLSFLCQI